MKVKNFKHGLDTIYVGNNNKILWKIFVSVNACENKL